MKIKRTSFKTFVLVSDSSREKNTCGIESSLLDSGFIDITVFNCVCIMFNVLKTL